MPDESAELPALTPGAERPPVDPFDPERHPQWRALPPGTPVTLLLGDHDRRAEHRRAVRGRAVGYAVRHRDYLDLQLDHIVTWRYGHPPTRLEALDASYVGAFRVSLRRSVQHTLALLQGVAEGDEGRSVLAAGEVPFRTCYRCRERVDREGAFCHHCGARLRVAPPGGLPLRAPAPEDEHACPACWVRRPGEGAYCRHCGYERALNDLLARMRGSTLRGLLVEGRERLGVVSGRLCALRIERLFQQGSAQLVAELTEVAFEGEAPVAFGRAPSAEFVATVSVQTDGRLRSTLRALQGGERLRISEIKERCVACEGDGEGGDAPFVLGRHCVRCGARGRLLPHPELSERLQPRPGRQLITHGCGATCRRGVDRHCHGCGASLVGDAGSSGRFARLR